MTAPPGMERVLFTEEQVAALKGLSARTGLSMAELIRRSVDRLVRTPQSDEERWKRARAAVGGAHSGHSDVSVNHDRYLAEDEEEDS